MSVHQVGLACSLLRENFGELVEKVGSYLLHHGGVSLSDIVKGTLLKENQVKKSLCVLIQHQFVTFEPHEKGSHMIYRIDVSIVLLLIRYPRCIHTGKVLFGDAGELIIEDILQQGQSLMSLCIQRVSERLEESLTNSGHDSSGVGRVVKQQFIALVEGHFLQRVKPCNLELGLVQHGTQEVGGVTTMPLEHKFVLPSNMSAINYVRSESRKRKREDGEGDDDQPIAKKSKQVDIDEQDQPDVGILWHINFDRFHQYFRDQALVQAVSQRVDSAAGCVIRTLLNLASNLGNDSTSCSQAYSPEVYAHQVSEGMTSKPKLTREEVDQYLRALAEDETRILCKDGVSGGGVYKVDFKRGCELLCKSTIEVVVRERFGSKTYRVFRLLLLKKMLEQKQVADMAMLPGKEAKEILYTLLAESFVSLQEVPRTPDYAPSRTFYLFKVNLQQVARMLLERCYQALHNLIVKRTTETIDNKRLLDKYEMFERQQLELETLGGEGEEAVEELLTPDEKKKAEGVRRSVTKLEHAELQLDESVMMITNYLKTLTSNS